MSKLHLQSLLVAIICASTSVQAQSERDVPLQSRITRVQPMTGIVLWTDHDKVATEAISLEYRYCGYDEVVQPDGTYDYSKLDSILNQIAKRGHQAVLRFYFVYVGKKTTVPQFIRNRPDYKETVGKSEGKKTHFCDWSNKALQDFVIEFYSRFAQRYDNDSRLAFVQTGFGLWAEYHIYDGPRKLGQTFPSKDYQSRFFKHLSQTFVNLPWSVSVDAADYDYSPLEDNDQLLPLPFGVFDDSFLCRQHPKENAMNWKALNLQRWKTSPAGGEFSYYNNRDQKNALAENGPNGVPFTQAAKQFHISYMIGNDQPKYRSMADIARAGMATGYRFKVTSATRTGDTLRLNVVNEGIAPIYRNAFFTAGNKRSQQSLKGLLPGSSLECVIKNVRDADITSISIQSDAILKTQTIQFEANLR